MSNKNQNNVSEKKLISQFILNLNGKNYNNAHKYLHKIVEQKLNKRLEKTINNF